MDDARMDSIPADWTSEALRALRVFAVVWAAALFGAILLFVDWLGRRKERKSRNRAA
jgi:hypothetical protein